MGVDADNADLASVDTKLADAGAPTTPAPGQDPAAVALVLDPAAEWAQAPQLFFSLVEDELPELKAIYTPERCMKWGAAMVPLAKKYGWTFDDMLSWLGPWIGFGIATHRLVTPTAKVIYLRVKEYREAAARKAAEQQPQA